MNKIKKRPDELSQFLSDLSKDNDTLIIDALEKLEDPLRRGNLKATVETIVELTGLARNTIRNRNFALIRLKKIKDKDRVKLPLVAEKAAIEIEEKTVEDLLREQVAALTEQNVLLFTEVLTLHEANAKLHRAMDEIKHRKLHLV